MHHRRKPLFHIVEHGQPGIDTLETKAIKAENLQMEIVEKQKRILRKDHPDMLSSMAGLASTYWKQRRLDKAEKLEVEVSETRKRVLRERHADTLRSMANL